MQELVSGCALRPMLLHLRGETVERFESGLEFAHPGVGGRWHLGDAPRACARSEQPIRKLEALERVLRFIFLHYIRQLTQVRSTYCDFISFAK
jgi:hypothetical protein